MKGTAQRVVRGLRPLWHRRRRSIIPILFLAPAAVLFALFVLYPIAASLRLSLFEWHGIGPKTWIGLGNFRALFADPVFNTAFRNNLIWLALIPAAPAMGLAIALLLDRASARMRLARILFFLPFVMSQRRWKARSVPFLL
jgi:multiple sugar transport system permease protein